MVEKNWEERVNECVSERVSKKCQVVNVRSSDIEEDSRLWKRGGSIKADDICKKLIKNGRKKINNKQL